MVPGGCVHLVGGDSAPAPTPLPRAVARSRRCGRSPFGNLISVRPPALVAFCVTPMSLAQGGQVMARARKQLRGAGRTKQGRAVKRAAKAADLVITHRHAAGIDIHAAEHFVSVPPEDVPANFV